MNSPHEKPLDSDSAMTQSAERQLRDYDEKTPGTLFDSQPLMPIDDAYTLQTAVTRLRENRGERVIGYKVGCTSNVIQRQFGIDRPVFGRLWNSECHLSGVRLAASQFASPAIEGELALQLAATISPQASDSELIDSIGWVVPVIELHHYVFRSETPNASELIANNAFHAGFVHARKSSQRVVPQRPDSSLTIKVNGHLIDSFRGRELGDSVLRSMRFLADILPKHGLALTAGQFILTGSLMQLIPIRPPSHILVDAGPWGAVEAEIGA